VCSLLLQQQQQQHREGSEGLPHCHLLQVLQLALVLLVAVGRSKV
jgi:hypothetical protein